MYSFCKTNDELACVIGHEINHNELGHIKEHLQKERLISAEGAAILVKDVSKLMNLSSLNLNF